MEFKLPELGENITSGGVTEILVNVGDTIVKDQNILQLETDKAVVDVPSNVTGVVKEILVKAGDTVDVGQTIFVFDSNQTKDQRPETSDQKEETQTHSKKQSDEESASAPNDSSPKAQNNDNYDCDVVVIGAGPGGYTCAFHAADLGLKTVLVTTEPNPGGVCLYWGCIPSKALLHAAKVMNEAKEASEYGITFNEPKINMKKLRGWKQGVVDQLTGGLGQLTKKRGIQFIQGRASFLDSNTLNIEGVDSIHQRLTFNKAIIATGSSPIEIPAWPHDSKRLINSTGALAFEDIPQSMLIVGGGVIGLEMGTVYAEFGTKIDVVEMLPQLLTGADKDLVSVLDRRLKKLFNEIMLETKVLSMSEEQDEIKVSFENKKGEKFERSYSKVLVSVGRHPNSQYLGLENTKVVVDEKGFIKANAQLQTTDPSIFAIGDVIGQPMLAHKASHEGIVAAEVIAGKKAAFEPKTIPGVVYTDPEVAWCGITEAEAKEQGIDIHVAKFPWGASGRALTQGRTDGLTKLIFDPETEVILGMGIVGPGAGELIAEGVLAVEMGATATDIKMSIHPHPTTSETIMESAESFFGHATHMYRPKKK